MAGLGVSKDIFFGRLDARSRLRYGGDFSESWYETLNDDGLAFPFERDENSGLSPVYFATPAHYRRALQLKRLHALGITGRDAQLIQLFVRGYGVESWQVREAIRSEAVRALTKIRPMLRSSYFQNSRDVGPKHFASLERQLGPLDGRFAAAGLKQPREFYLTVVRVGYGALSDENSEKLRGILLADKNSEQLPEFIEGALKSDPEAYAKVRVVFRWANQFLFRPLVGDGIINSPEFTVCSLVSMLAAEKLGFSMSHVLDKLPAPQGFQALVSSFCDAVGERNKS